MKLNCEFINYSSVEYICRVTKAYELSPIDGRVKDINGTHLEGKSNANVNTFIIADQQIKQFPSNLYKYFPNLKSISIISCGLTTLSKDDLVGLSRLQKLMLNGNLITSFHSDVFDLTPNLERISFYKNQISYLPKDAFDSLKKLKSINLENNTDINWSCREVKHGRTMLDEIKINLSNNLTVGYVGYTPRSCMKLQMSRMLYLEIPIKLFI
ncbi:immunoglobulin superfamily containing leucine-rich repeat protein-like [Chironomus tepperi]|uniref:immunoglobulin superfamily containing leucine-rich repeat protein-like n=1 Tax=Chironomus tepperi TaxID=113505 RepID=UPI00391F24D8